MWCKVIELVLLNGSKFSVLWRRAIIYVNTSLQHHNPNERENVAIFFSVDLHSRAWTLLAFCLLNLLHLQYTNYSQIFLSGTSFDLICSPTLIIGCGQVFCLNFIPRYKSRTLKTKGTGVILSFKTLWWQMYLNCSYANTLFEIALVQVLLKLFFR